MFSVVWKSDLFDIHSIKQSWKVLENAHKKVVESHEKPLSVFCMHRGQAWTKLLGEILIVWTRMFQGPRNVEEVHCNQ